MKRIKTFKTFETLGRLSPEDYNIKSNKPNKEYPTGIRNREDDDEYDYTITPEEFQDIVNDIMNLPVKEQAKELKNLKTKYPYIYDIKPYSDIFWKAAQKWSDDPNT